MSAVAVLFILAAEIHFIEILSEGVLDLADGISVGVPARACDRGRVRVSFDAHRRPVAPHGSSVAAELGDSATERQLPTQWYVFRVSSGGAAAGHRVRARPAGERLV